MLFLDKIVKSNSILDLCLNVFIFFLILYILLYFKPLADWLLEIINFTEIGDFFVNENFIMFSKLLPLPEINTATFFYYHQDIFSFRTTLFLPFLILPII